MSHEANIKIIYKFDVSNLEGLNYIFNFLDYVRFNQGININGTFKNTDKGLELCKKFQEILDFKDE
jgi:hypothetical protein